MNRTEYDDLKANLIKKSLEKNKTDVYVPIERRKGIDLRQRFINVMCFILWSFFIINIAIIEKAGKSIMNISRNGLLWANLEFWKPDLLKISLCITIISIFCCTICIIFNFTRRKRRSDKIKKSLIFCEIGNFIVGIFLILKLF